MLQPLAFSKTKACEIDENSSVEPPDLSNQWQVYEESETNFYRNLFRI